MKTRLLSNEVGSPNDCENHNQSNKNNRSNRQKARCKKLGRKRKKRLFDETRIGHFIKHEAPLEYKLIVDISGSMTSPSAELIEAIGYASLAPLFKKPKFRKALIEYRKHGLYSGVPKKSNAQTERYYIKIRSSCVKALQSTTNVRYE